MVIVAYKKNLSENRLIVVVILQNIPEK